MGLIVQSLRESLGMNRYALARDAWVDNSWLRRFETGKSGIRVETLIALARGESPASNHNNRNGKRACQSRQMA